MFQGDDFLSHNNLKLHTYIAEIHNVHISLSDMKPLSCDSSMSGECHEVKSYLPVQNCSNNTRSCWPSPSTTSQNHCMKKKHRGLIQVSWTIPKVDLTMGFKKDLWYKQDLAVLKFFNEIIELKNHQCMWNISWQVCEVFTSLRENLSL